MRADRCLNGYFEQLSGDERLEPLDQCLAGRLRIRAVDDEAQRVHGLAVDQHVELHQVAGPIADVGVVEAGVAARSALEQVVEVDDQLGQRHLEMEDRPASDRGTPCS